MDHSDLTKHQDATAIPDEPVRLDSEDHLDRGRFADALAAIIDGADAGSSLRMGIYGGWGEGKTSVLNLMKYRLQLRGHKCVFLTSWASTSRQQLLERLLRAIAAELDIKLWASARQWAKSLRGLMKPLRHIATVDPRIKAADAILGDAVQSVFGLALEKAAAQQTELVLRAINEKLGNRKLVVFVDDIDRLNPELVPDVLLTLREALNQPKYFYVMALSPEIVEEGLRSVHWKWGEPATFLEKIVELPRYLPAISDEQLDIFVKRQLATLSNAPDHTTLLGMRRLLPRNARKLKLFLRTLAAVSCDRDRFDVSEIQWDVFYLAQLLRVEFPVEAARMIEDPAVLKDLELGAMLAGTERAKAAEKQPKAYEKYLPTAVGSSREQGNGYGFEWRRERFVQLCEGIRERPRWRGRYSLRDLFLLPDEPPSVTWKEVEKIVSRFQQLAPNNGEVVESAVRENGQITAARLRALFDALLEMRELVMGAAVEEPTDAKVAEQLVRTDAIIEMLSLLVRRYGVFRDELLGVSAWAEVVKQFQRWGHFEAGLYEATRRKEREFLATILETCPYVTTLAILNQARAFSPNLGGRARLQAHLQGLFLSATRKLAQSFITDLQSTDALSPLYSDDMRALRDIVFNEDSILYMDEHLRKQWESVARESATSLVVQTNMVRMLGMADYGAFGRGGSLSSAGCEKLLRNTGILKAIWSAATACPLQHREAGGLLEDRAHLVEAGISAEILPIPAWLAVYVPDGDNARSRRG